MWGSDKDITQFAVKTEINSRTRTSSLLLNILNLTYTDWIIIQLSMEDKFITVQTYFYNEPDVWFIIKSRQLLLRVRILEFCLSIWLVWNIFFVQFTHLYCKISRRTKGKSRRIRTKWAGPFDRKCLFQRNFSHLTGGKVRQRRHWIVTSFWNMLNTSCYECVSE